MNRWTMMTAMFSIYLDDDMHTTVHTTVDWFSMLL